jgi:hypothetical protein
MKQAAARSRKRALAKIHASSECFEVKQWWTVANLSRPMLEVMFV